tara:strand:+ start:1011 stop:1181 length:171 start_codon:yes stop_codon:yes gene_type:complete
MFSNKDIGLIWDSLDKNISDSMSALLNTDSTKRSKYLKLKIKNLNQMKTKMREAAK